jgi:phage FluMu protein gp41
MPTSEHILIDALHREWAKVISSTGTIPDERIWIVAQNRELSPRALRRLRQMVEELDEIFAEEEVAADQPGPAPSPQAS